MKVLHISFSDNVGGASKAALRLCKAQRNFGIDAEMLVFKKSTDFFFVKQVSSGSFAIGHRIKEFLVRKILALQHSDNAIMHSLNLFPGHVLALINSSDADIVNLHWMNNEMISIRQIAGINKKIVWTMHDTWAFCGAEHYPENMDDERFIAGYTKANNRNRGWDIDRWTWKRKVRHWNNAGFTFSAPSEWMRKCISSSFLFKNRPVYKIPNPINLEIFKPHNKTEARKILHLDPDKKYILFGAEGGTKQHIKGFDLLESALKGIGGKLDRDKYGLLIFGTSAPVDNPDMGLDTIYFGRLHDEITMALLYSSADCMVVPSRIDNLPQTAVEAACCGTPVVAFNICGLPDIIEHKVTGYLAQPFDTEDLGNGIIWITQHPEYESFRERTRVMAVNKFSEQKCVEEYVSLYQNLFVADVK